MRSRRAEPGARINSVRFLITLFLFANVVSADEVPLAIPPIGPAPGYRTNVAAASNGRGFLAVSREGRPERIAIYGMHGDDRGRPLDPVMFPISGDSDSSVDLTGVASDGDSYLVAWTTQGSDNRFTAHFARVDDQGNVTPGGSIVNVGDVTVAWGGSAYVAGYVDGSNESPDVAVIASDGTVLRSGIPIVSGAAFPRTMHISSGAPATVIATWTGNDAHVHAVTAHTSALRDGSYATPVSDESGTFPLSPVVSPATAASNGSQSLVVWTETIYPVQPGGRTTTVRARRLNAGGTPIGDPFTVAQLYDDTWPNLRPAVAWNGSAFVIAYSHMSDLGGTVVAVGADDHVTKLREFHNSSPGDFPLIALAGNDHGGLFVWNSGQLNGAFVDNTVGAAWLFSPASATQLEPSIAWCGDAYRAVWIERSQRSRVLSVRVGANGLPIGPVSPVADSDGWQTSPRIACSGSTAMVVWHELNSQPYGTTVRVALIAADGTPQPASDLGPAHPGVHAVAWNGSEYLAAAWQGPGIGLFRISPDGRTFSALSPPYFGRIAFDDPSLSLAWNGSEYLMTWSEGVTSRTIKALRLSPALTPIGSPSDLSPAGNVSAPVVAAGNGEWLVAWSEDANGRYARLDAELRDLERGSLAGRPSDATYTGNGYRVVTDNAAVSHGASVAAVIHPRLTSELLTRLYISIDSARPRPARH